MNRSVEPVTARVLRVACYGLALVLVGCAAPGPKPSEEPPPGGLVIADGDAETMTPEQRYQMALDLMRRNQMDEAQALFEALVIEVPDHSGPLTNLGILHARAQRWSESRSALLQAVKVNERNAVAWNELGRVERQRNNAAGARDAFLKAIQHDPRLPAAHLNLGLVLESPLGDAEGALKHYREYLSLEGGNDLRVLVWIAELERGLASNSPARPEAAP